MNISKKSIFINYKYFFILPFLLCISLVLTYDKSDTETINYNVEKNEYLQTSYLFDETDGYMDSIDIIDSKPISDNSINSITEYRFSVKNVNNESINYYIKIIPNEEMIDFEGCRDNLIDYSYLRYKLDSSGISFFADAEDGILYKGHLEKGSSNVHSLKIWVTNLVDGNSFNKHFHGKIQIYKIFD